MALILMYDQFRICKHIRIYILHDNSDVKLDTQKGFIIFLL